MTTTAEDYVPYLIAVNLTQSCNLRCAHCYLDAKQRREGQSEELSGAEVETLLRDIGARAPGTIVVLTGGEPLLRPDITEIVASGSAAGLRVVMGTNGVGLRESNLRALKEAGLAGVGISIDSVHAGEHDEFRGVPGAFEKSCSAVRLCVSNGVHAQVHFTVTTRNHDQIPEIVDLGKRLGAAIVNYFFLVCVGRGRAIMDLTPELYEVALVEISQLQARSEGIMVQARCAPHFKRILYENDPLSPLTRAQGYDGGGCIAATHYCRVDPMGEVTPCPYMETSAGNIRSGSFWEIWDNSPLFASLRQPRLEGRCGECEYQLLCGGCRARSLVQCGELMAEDPSCAYTPTGGQVIAVASQDPAVDEDVHWTDDALQHLERIPIFLRRIVKRKLEQEAKAQDIPIITTDMMKRMRRRREKELGVKFKK